MRQHEIFVHNGPGVFSPFMKISWNGSEEISINIYSFQCLIMLKDHLHRGKGTMQVKYEIGRREKQGFIHVTENPTKINLPWLEECSNRDDKSGNIFCNLGIVAPRNTFIKVKYRSYFYE